MPKPFTNRSTTSSHRSPTVKTEMAGSGIQIAASVPLLLLLLCCCVNNSMSSRASLPHAAGKSHRDERTCVYTIYIRTGSIWKAGTDSIISLALGSADGSGVLIEDLESWGGLMGAGYDYYERGNLDIFSGRGPCLSSWPPCWANLSSDGSGPHHGWYCNYVEVTTTGPHMGCAQQKFTIEQWLARDASPYRLYAARNLCPSPSPSPDDDDDDDDEITSGELVARDE